MPDNIWSEMELQAGEVALKMALMLWRNSGLKDPTLADQNFVKLVASCAMALQGKYALFDFRRRTSEANRADDLG